MIGGPFQKGIRQGRILSTSTSSAASPVGRRTCSEGALSFSRPRLASGVAGIAGRLLCGLMGNAGQPGSFALGSARIASDVDRVAGGLSFGECRVVYPGSRSKLLQFRLLRVRGCAQPVIKTRPL